MKLADMALALDDEADGDEPEAEPEAEDAGAFEEAAGEAFELFKQGKKAEASAALKGAIESCVADYMAEE